MSNNEPVKQHYIPQVYLRNFCNENDKLCLFDTVKNEIFENMTTKKVLLQRHFYTFTDEKGNKDYQLEEWFSEIESNTKPIFDKIINKQTITINEKEQLALFIALLQNRTPTALDLQDSFAKPAMEWMKNMHLYNGDFDGIIKECPLGEDKGREYIKKMDMSLTKQAQWHMQIEQAITFANYYTNMEWTFFYTKHGSFITTDNPLIILSESKNIGIGIKGNTKIVALSSEIVLMIGDVGKVAVHGSEINDKKQIRNLNILLFLNRNRFAIADNIGLLENLQKRCKNKKIRTSFVNIAAQ